MQGSKQVPGLIIKNRSDSMKKILEMLAVGFVALAIAGCGGGEKPAAKSAEKPTEKKVTLHVYSAASMTETMKKITEDYKKVAPKVEIVNNFDSSGTLKTQIQNGAECDIFISAAPKQMNQLDVQNTTDNKNKLDFVLEGTRINLLENKVVLAVPAKNPKGIKSFADLAKMLQAGTVRLIMGNSDVPVGQYTQKILSFYKLDEKELANKGLISYGSNVKEVTTQVKEASGDCGVVYGTDAYSAKLQTVGSATKEMCGQVIYPAAVMKKSKNQEAAKAFLKYLQGPEATKVFESVGFNKAK